MVVDDQKYEPSTIRRLERMGYSVRIARTIDEATGLLTFWLPDVVLTDLHLPTRSAGERVMREALAAPSVKVVIAISRARVPIWELPEGVEDCCGGLDYQDAERIHRLIWRRAAAEGVTEHA
ncbi:MAG: hypothetical protein ACK47B_12370 [Armatimonadota bacterium]